MWGALGLGGSAVGAFGGEIADRFDLGRPLAVTWLGLAAALAFPQTLVGTSANALGSAAAFGAAFTTGFAFIAMWSQEAFPDRPTTGFTATIVCIAAGFAVGPVLYVVLRADLAGVGAGVPTIDVRPFAGGDLLLGEVDDGHGCIPVLHAGGRDHHGDQQTDGVGDQASSIWRRGHCGGRPVRPGGSKMCSAAAHSASVNPHG